MNNFPARCHSRRNILTADVCLSNQSFPHLSVSSICFRSSKLISPLLTSHPLISSSPSFYFSLCIFSHSHISLPPTNPSYLYCHSLSPFLFPIQPHYLHSCINHCLLNSGFHSLLFKCLLSLPPSLTPYTSISGSISGAHIADGGGPLSPLREQKVCPLPLRLCVMEHREIETEEKEQMGGGHTGCLFYNITPNNAVVIIMTI